jgi:hypothetical protein
MRVFVQAHWFYEDNVREQTEGLKSLSLKEFSEQMFQSVPQFKKYKKHIEDIYANFNSYKVPALAWSWANQPSRRHTVSKAPCGGTACGSDMAAAD